jgi:tRNA U34 5-carboxymethylaminomethyl modifying GTPase MnmE/TrmE
MEIPSEWLPRDIVETTANNVQIRYSPYPYQIIEGPGDPVPVDEPSEWSMLVRGQKPLENGCRLTLGYPCNWLLENNVELVDTPGINTVICNHIDTAWKSIHNSKICLYLMDCRNICLASDFQFLEAARHQTGLFIFVVSQIDMLGVSDVKSPEVNRIVDALKDTLKQNGFKWLDVCAVSSKISDPEKAGRKSLQEILLSHIRHRGYEITYKLVCAHGLKCVNSILDSTSTRHNILQSTDSVDVGQFKSKSAEFDAEIINLGAQRMQGILEIEGFLDKLKFSTLNDVTDISKETLERLQLLIEKITLFSELVNQGPAVFQSEISKWTGDVSQIMNEVRDKIEAHVEAAGADLTNEFSNRLSVIYETKVAVDFSSNSSPLTLTASQHEMQQLISCFCLIL